MAASSTHNASPEAIAAIGRAYGFFNSQCTEGGIVSRIERIRPGWRHELLLPLQEPLVKTATRYRICHTMDVKDGAIASEAGPQLWTIAQELHGRGANYLLKLSMPGSSGERAAGELQAFLGALCSEPVPVMERIGDARTAVYFLEGNAYRIVGGQK